MKFAYLILAHKSPEQLLKLVQAIEGRNTSIFVHIDKKVDMDPFYRLLEKSVIFCTNRIDISWGGFSMVEATVALIRLMADKMEIPDYVHLLSGQDFPLKSNEYIYDFFRRFEGFSFIRHEKLPKADWDSGGIDRLEYKWKIDELGYEKAFELVKKEKRIPVPDYIKPFGGSQWWSLHKECIAYLLEQCNEKNKVYTFFRDTLCSDEMVFQTILGNSPLINRVINCHMRHIDWTIPGTQPHVWTNEDLGLLKNLSCLFARKFHNDEALENIEKSVKIYQPRKEISFDREHPAISVVMSVYNAEKYLIECIESILNQSFTDFELIIVDDGSTDKSAEIVSSYDDHRIRWIKNEHDYTGSLNLGVKSSKGKYIVRMDSDDVMIPERLEIQYQFMEKHPEISASGGGAYFIGNRCGTYVPEKDPDKLKINLLLDNAILNATAIIRRDFLTKNRLQYDPDYMYAEDYKFWIELSKKGKLSNVSEQLLMLRCHHEQISAAKSTFRKNISSVIQYELTEYYMGKLDRSKPLSGTVERFYKDMNTLRDAGVPNNHVQKTVHELFEWLMRKNYFLQ